jgi:hypothetical protein
MRHDRSASDYLDRPLQSRGTGSRLLRAALAGGLCLATPAIFSIRPDAPPVRSAGRQAAPAPVVAALVAPNAPEIALLLDPTPVLAGPARGFAQRAPLAPSFRMAAAPVVPVAARPVTVAELPPRAPRPVQLAEIEPAAPLPMPRPAELLAPKAPDAPRLTERRPSRRDRLAAMAAPQPDNRSFFEKLFGVENKPGPALAYAALQNGPLQMEPTRPLNPSPSAGGATAIYDISAKRVYMPNGETLEAHSGLGTALDDPRMVHVRMRGATPPHVYELTEREQLFHGVRALRLNPVGGSGAIFGRAGLLAHTFMLGPNGDSNGCVSFRDYDRFLQAYLRGEVKRLVVVSGRSQDGMPGFAKALFGTARNDNPA